MGIRSRAGRQASRPAGSWLYTRCTKYFGTNSIRVKYGVARAIANQVSAGRKAYLTPTARSEAALQPRLLNCNSNSTCHFGLDQHSTCYFGQYLGNIPNQNLTSDVDVLWKEKENFVFWIYFWSEIWNLKFVFFHKWFHTLCWIDNDTKQCSCSCAACNIIRDS